MTTMLILIVLKLGTVTGIFLGDYDYPNACEEAAQVIAQEYFWSGELKDADAAGLICVPRPEA